MKKIFSKNYYIIAGILVLFLCTFTGCNTASENINNIDVNNTTHIEEEITNGDGRTIAKINADVAIPKYDSYSVATISKYEFTNSEIKRIADSLFDNSEYYKQLTESEYSVDQLNETIEEYNLKIRDVEQLYNDGIFNHDEYESSVDYYNSCIEELTDLIPNAPLEANNEPICELITTTHTSQSYAIDSAGNEEVTDYTYTTTGCFLEGTYKDTPCTLNFDLNPFGEVSGINTNIIGIYLDRSDQSVWKNYTYKEINPGADKYKNFISVNPDIENQCKYSTDQAIDICNEFLESLEISDMAPMDICNISVKAYSTSPSGITYGAAIENGYCGYTIYYGKSINNITTNLTLYSTGAFNFSMTPNERGMIGHESIIFTVMDCGIVSMAYFNPTVVEDITSTSTPILEFDTIMELADSYLLDVFLEEKDKSSRISPIKISKIQFGLARVIYDRDDLTYTLVPVWDFYEDNTSFESDIYPTPMLTINAIDGSRINSFTSEAVK